MVKNGPSITAGPGPRAPGRWLRQGVHGLPPPPAVAVAQRPRPLGLGGRRGEVAALAQRDVRERRQQHELEGGPVAGLQVSRGLMQVVELDDAFGVLAARS